MLGPCYILGSTEPIDGVSARELDVTDMRKMRSIVSRKGAMLGGQPKAFALTESGRNLFTRLIAQLGKFEAEQHSGISQQDLAVSVACSSNSTTA